MSKKRDAAVEGMSEAMRDFMARAVLYQDAVARFAGLNSTDLQCAGLLMSLGPATPGELAERTGLSSGGAITAVIDRLEKAGVVSRERDPDDRRRVIVTANPEVVFAKVGPIYQRMGERWGDYLATLTDEQLAFATELITRAAEVNRIETDALRSQR